MNPKPSVPSIIKKIVESINTQPPVVDPPIRSAIEVFISYSHEDSQLRNELETHLSLLKNQGTVKLWHDRCISPGQDWSREISNHLNRANIILLLISADFIASGYCYGIEMHRAMELYNKGKARVIPIILRPCDWTSAPFGRLQALPTEAKPVTEWRTHDDAFLDVVNGIRRVIDELNPSVNK